MLIAGVPGRTTFTCGPGVLTGSRGGSITSVATTGCDHHRDYDG
jgi:hypothetical protein